MLVARSYCVVRNCSLHTATSRYRRCIHTQDPAPFQDPAPYQDLASLGLGGHSPVGLIQTALDYVHLHTGLPWWATIATVTVAMRLTMLPLSIRMYTYGSNLVNVKAGAAKINANIARLREEGRNEEADDECVRLVNYFADNNASPLKIVIMPFLQLPIFLTFLYSLHQMAVAPVESMKMGGALWFTDLTASDPYHYLLPTLSAVMFAINFELGAETGMETELLYKMKVGLRAACLIFIPVSSFLPSCVFIYWLTSSTYSLILSRFFKISRVRHALGIPSINTT